MPRRLGRSPALLFPGLLAWLVLAGPASAEPPAAAGGDAPAFADAHSVAAVARTARGLRLGARLHLEGLTLEPGEPPVGLDLVRFEVFAPDGRLVVHGPDGTEERAFPGHAYFRGRVIGDPASLAVVTVLDDGGVRGIVRRGQAYWELGAGPRRPDGSRGLAGRRVEAPEDAGGAGFACAAEELAPPPEALESAAAPATASDDGSEPLSAEATATSYTARVAVETDNELLFNRFGGDEAAATAYVGDLFAYASSVYDREIATDLRVTHLSLWKSADPYAHERSCGLYEFGSYWNRNRTGVDRTIAHFVSGKSSRSGVAWIGVLCSGGFDLTIGSACSGLPSSGPYGGDYGFSGGISGSFNPASPSPVWDIVAVSHEIGHNFDSPHTHCYNGIGGSSSPVDECYNGQSASGCYGGTARLPGPAGEGSGTLMSYCHLLSPGMSNLSLTFGTGHPYGVLPQRVPDRMRAHVESRAASFPACLARQDDGSGGGGGGTCDDESLPAQTVSTTELFEACSTLRAGAGGFAVVDPGDVTLRGATVVLESGFSVGSGATLRVETH